MAIYHIRRLDPDDIGYDEAVAFVVIAANPDAARRLVIVPKPGESKHTGDEGSLVWLDETRTEVIRLGISSDSTERVILRDFRAG